MYLLKKINPGGIDFEFYKILESSYKINEVRNTIKKVQYENGRRKRIDTDYIDCVISIDIGGIDNSDLASYITNLQDGQYQYWSIKDRAYKKANFLVNIPELVANRVYSTTEYFLDDFTITLEKSSDGEC